MATLYLNITSGGRVADDIVDRVRASLDGATSGRAAHDIAATINRMITTGDLPAGTRLPTVRELARQLGISPTTVSEAWRRLSDVGAIDARGRRGTFVVESPRQRGP